MEVTAARRCNRREPGLALRRRELLAGLGATGLAGPARATKSSAQVTVPTLLADYAEAWSIPGLAVAVAHGGSAAVHVHGRLAAGGDRPVDAETRFRLNSVTKTFLSLAVAMLVDDGKLRFDDTVIGHLPHFALRNRAAGASATIRDLLSHRSGAGKDIEFLPGLVEDTGYARAAVALKTIGPRHGQVGYSNHMFDVIGELVSKVAGIRWDQFLQKRLFAPLGMNATTVDPLGPPIGDAVSRRALPPPFLRDGLLIEHLNGDPVNLSRGHLLVDGRPRPLPYTRYISAPGSASALHSTANDLARWLSFLTNRGRVGDRALLRPTTFAAWMTPQVGSGSEDAPALGWFTGSLHGQRWVAHRGAGGGNVSAHWLLPDADIGVAALLNIDHLDGGAAACHGLVTAIIDRFLASAPIGRLAEAQAEWSREKAAEAVRRQRLDGLLAAGGGPAIDLAAWAGTYVHPVLPPIRLERGDAGWRIAYRDYTGLRVEPPHGDVALGVYDFPRRLDCGLRFRPGATPAFDWFYDAVDLTDPGAIPDVTYLRAV